MKYGRGGAPSLPPPSKRTAMETIVQDVRYAFRQFVHRPGFTAIAVLSLGLAIGGNSLIYGLVDGFVFRPFPFPDPDRLVAVGVAFPKVSSEVDYIETLSPPEYLDIRSAKSFAHVGSFDLGNRNITGGDVPERVFTARAAGRSVFRDRHGAGPRPRIYRRASSRRTGRRSRSSVTGCGKRGSAPTPASSIARSGSAAGARRWWASCRRVCS